MTATRWKREGKKGGPGNVLDGRWEVCRYENDGWWFVFDLEWGEVKRGNYATMREARRGAERRAARAGSEAWS